MCVVWRCDASSAIAINLPKQEEAGAGATSTGTASEWLALVGVRCVGRHGAGACEHLRVSGCVRERLDCWLLAHRDADAGMPVSRHDGRPCWASDADQSKAKGIGMRGDLGMREKHPILLGQGGGGARASFASDAQVRSGIPIEAQGRMDVHFRLPPSNRSQLYQAAAARSRSVGTAVERPILHTERPLGGRSQPKKGAT